MDYIATLYAAVPMPSGFQWMIFGVLCGIALFIYLCAILPDRPQKVVTKSMVDDQIHHILEESHALPYETQIPRA